MATADLVIAKIRSLGGVAPELLNLQEAYRRRVAAVNRALHYAGRSERLVRAKDYYFFAGGEAATWRTSAVMINAAELLTVREWLDEFDALRTAR